MIQPTEDRGMRKSVKTEDHNISKKRPQPENMAEVFICSVLICPVGVELVHPLPYIEPVCAAYHAVGEDRVHLPVCSG